MIEAIAFPILLELRTVLKMARASHLHQALLRKAQLLVKEKIITIGLALRTVPAKVLKSI